jgi:protein subunit release factor B
MSRELLFSVSIKDCEVETFRSGGKGGQNQNKRDTGVRIRHRPSGAVGESREERSQLENKRRAFRRMVQSPEFERWRKRTAAELAMSGAEKRRREQEIQAEVIRLMQPDKLLVEVRQKKGWVPIEGTSA